MNVGGPRRAARYIALERHRQRTLGHWCRALAVHYRGPAQGCGAGHPVDRRLATRFWLVTTDQTRRQPPGPGGDRLHREFVTLLIRPAQTDEAALAVLAGDTATG